MASDHEFVSGLKSRISCANSRFVKVTGGKGWRNVSLFDVGDETTLDISRTSFVDLELDFLSLYGQGFEIEVGDSIFKNLNSDSKGLLVTYDDQQ
jgi:hypothetical protein